MESDWRDKMPHQEQAGPVVLSTKLCVTRELMEGDAQCEDFVSRQ